VVEVENSVRMGEEEKGEEKADDGRRQWRIYLCDDCEKKREVVGATTRVMATPSLGLRLADLAATDYSNLVSPAVVQSPVHVFYLIECNEKKAG
jgi:hypothetical protein